MCYTIDIIKYFHLFARQKPLHHNSVLITSEVRGSLSLPRSSDNSFLVPVRACFQLSLSQISSIYAQLPLHTSHILSLYLLSGLMEIPSRSGFHNTKYTYLTVLFPVNLSLPCWRSYEIIKNPFLNISISSQGTSHISDQSLPISLDSHPQSWVPSNQYHVSSNANLPHVYLSESCNMGHFYLPKHYSIL